MNKPVYDTELILKKAHTCGKKIKVNEIVDIILYTFDQIFKENETINETKKAIGQDKFDELVSTIISLTSLSLLARVSSEKEFQEIIKEITVTLD